MKKLNALTLSLAIGAIAVSCDPMEPEVGNLALSLTGLEDLGSDYVYEGWIIVDGDPVSTGTFSINASGALSQSSFEVDQTSLDNATMFVLSIEPAQDSDPAPAATKVLSGAISGGSATLNSGIVGDFSNAAGSFFLRTPTDETDGNNGNDEAGIWFGDPTMSPPSATLVLPTLPDGWAYEGWVVGDNGPLTTGTFTDVAAADDSAPYSGSAGGPPIPGEDFFNNAPNGESFPLDIRGRTVVISVEPVPDNSAAPFAMKPLLVAAGNETAPATYSLGQNLGSLPTGTVSF